MSRIEAALKDVKFLVDADGKATAAVLDISAWSALLDALESSEDTRLARERLAEWKSKRGWTAWEQIEQEGDPA
jgi:hypothetical protein